LLSRRRRGCEKRETGAHDPWQLGAPQLFELRLKFFEHRQIHIAINAFDKR
jgi:hypothetical protein